MAIKRLRGPYCFVGGTLIHTEDGMRAVEEIAVGSKVWGFDRERQLWGLCVVTGASRTDSVRVVRAVLADGEELAGTPGHPVWVIEGEELELRGRPDEGADEKPSGTPGRWVGLVALRPGDALLTRSGPMRVSRVEEVSEATTVYNLIVGGVHSYAVGAAGVLAHNGGPEECAKAVNAADDVAKVKQAAKQTPPGKPAETKVTAKPAEPVANAPSTPNTGTNFPESGFADEVLKGPGFTQFNTRFEGTENAGYLQTTFAKKSGELYIDAIRSEVQKQGLGTEMLRRIIAQVEVKFGSGTIKSISGNLEGVNRTTFLAGGLEATPAYLQRVAMGFTEVVTYPSSSNGYKLVMRKPQ